MTTYQLVPYLLSVHLRNKPDETRPLDDLFGGKEQLADELGGLLTKHLGQLVRQPSKMARPPQIRIESVGVDGRHVAATMSPGRSGIKSKIRTPGGKETVRNFEDIELMELRHFFVYAAGGHRAVLLAERVGGAGAITALAALLKDAWRARHPDTVLEISAAAAEESWAASLAQRPVQGYRLYKPNSTSGNMLIGKHAVEYRLDVSPVARGARWKLDRKIKTAERVGMPLSQLIMREVVPVLAPGAASDTEAAGKLLDLGWQVAVKLQLEGGMTRTVFVEQSLATSLSFPILEGEDEPVDHPGNEDVLAAVKRIIDDGLLETWGIGKAHAQGCTWTSKPCKNSEGWKVQWDVVD